MRLFRQSGAIRDVTVRARRSLRWNGALGVARLIVARHICSRAEFVWYEGPLPSIEPRSVPLRLSQVPAADVCEMLRPLWTLSPREAAAKVARGGTAWTAAIADVPIFSCWTFRGATELRLGRRLLLPLPPGTVVLEQVYTTPSERGRGVAPAAIRAIATSLAGSADRLVAIVDIANSASRRAMVDAGLHETARTSARRIGPSVHTTIAGESPLADHLRTYFHGGS